MMKRENGISMIILIVTIIIMLILSVVVIQITMNDGSILDNATVSVDENTKETYKENIALEYTGLRYNNGLTTKEIFEKVTENLNLENTTYNINSKFMVIKTGEGYVFTLLENGKILDGEYYYLDDNTILEGEHVRLDIADGDIVLKQNGYIVGSNELKPFSGSYIITGTTTENVVKVEGEGTYNIVINDLNIDVSEFEKAAFDANSKKNGKGCYVNLRIEGQNVLTGGKLHSGLRFTNATANVNGVTDGSTLTITGNGSLYATGGAYAAGIGGGYSHGGGIVSNIIINSGNITVKPGANGCGIGGGLRGAVNNIIINGGNIQALPSNRFGIGSTGAVDNIIINGGVINAEGGEYAGAIGGNSTSNLIKITGGEITAKYTHKNSSLYSTIGGDCSNVVIEGGTIVCESTKGIGIGDEGAIENIELKGGNIFITAGVAKMGIQPVCNEENVYLTEIDLENINTKTQINSITTSDNLIYGIKDMYTTQDGKLYLYLPVGSREIEIVANNVIYTGNIETKENDTNLFVLKR